MKKIVQNKYIIIAVLIILIVVIFLVVLNKGSNEGVSMNEMSSMESESRTMGIPEVTEITISDEVGTSGSEETGTENSEATVEEDNVNSEIQDTSEENSEEGIISETDTSFVENNEDYWNPEEVPEVTDTISEAAREGAQIVFSASEPDNEGFFDVEVKAYNTEFEGIEFAIGFDADVVIPASWTSENSEYVQISDKAEGMTAYSSYIEDSEKIIVLAFSENDPDFSVSSGKEGTEVMMLRFKVVGEGISGLTLAEKNGGNVLCTSTEMIFTTFVIELPASINNGEDYVGVFEPAKN